MYAVEASAVAESAEKLVAANNLSERIIVIRGKVEDIGMLLLDLMVYPERSVIPGNVHEGLKTWCVFVMLQNSPRR